MVGDGVERREWERLGEGLGGRLGGGLRGRLGVFKDSKKYNVYILNLS